MTPDPKLNLAGAPVVALGGTEFFVPTLALRQTRIVVPGLLKLMPILNTVQTRIADGDAMGAAAISQDDVELMIDIVKAGLSRAYPAITRDDVLDLEVGFAELTAALGVIAKQTGLFAPVAAEAPKPGETAGEAAPLTSTASLPGTANIPANPGLTTLNAT